MEAVARVDRRRSNSSKPWDCSCAEAARRFLVVAVEVHREEVVVVNRGWKNVSGRLIAQEARGEHVKARDGRHDGA